MTGFEYAKTLDTNMEKMIVLILESTKIAYNMMGKNFDDLSIEEKVETLDKAIKAMLG